MDLAAPAPAPTKERDDGGANNPPQPQQPDQTKGNGTPPSNDAEGGQLLEEVDGNLFDKKGRYIFRKPGTCIRDIAMQKSLMQVSLTSMTFRITH